MGFDPISLTALTAAGSLAGAGVSAYGTYQKGQADSAAAVYAAQVARNNQIIAEQNAQHAEIVGEAQAAATSQKGAAKAAKIKVAQAASGIDVNSGSAVDVQAGEAETSALDTDTVLSNAELQAYGYRTQGTNFGAEAGLDDAKASQAKTGGILGAAGGLLSNASSLSGKWTGFNSTGSGISGGRAGEAE